MARGVVTIVTVDDDAHGCYLDGRLVGNSTYMGEDAIEAMRRLAGWLGFAPETLQRTPEELTALGGTWPDSLEEWWDSTHLRGRPRR